MSSARVNKNPGVGKETMREAHARMPEAARDRYAVPALERGLDILEHVALRDEGQSLSEIATDLGLSPAAIFRTMACLERRGYVEREGPKDLYRLTLRLFELSHATAPMKRLLDVALPEMRALAAEIGQSCHLGIEADGDLLIVADVESPRPVNLAFRVGARWPLLTTVSGRVLLAHQADDVRDAAVLRAGSDTGSADLGATLKAIRKRGYDLTSDETLSGITDIGAPVIGRDGAVAALTVAYVRPSRRSIDFKPVISQLREAASRVSRGIGGAAFRSAA